MESLTFTQSIKHVCLPVADSPASSVGADEDFNLTDIEQNGECWISGWGETKGNRFIQL